MFLGGFSLHIINNILSPDILYNLSQDLEPLYPFTNENIK